MKRESTTDCAIDSLVYKACWSAMHRHLLNVQERKVDNVNPVSRQSTSTTLFACLPSPRQRNNRIVGGDFKGAVWQAIGSRRYIARGRGPVSSPSALWLRILLSHVQHTYVGYNLYLFLLYSLTPQRLLTALIELLLIILILNKDMNKHGIIFPSSTAGCSVRWITI